MRLLVVVALLSVTIPTQAHEMWTKAEAEAFDVAQSDNWVNGKQHPITDVSCCGQDDCEPLNFDDVLIIPGGYRIKDTGEFIPENETQPSEDTRHWICRYTSAEKKGMARCFFPALGGV